MAIRYLAGTRVSGTVEFFISIIPGRRCSTVTLDSQSTSKVASFCKERMMLCLHRDQREQTKQHANEEEEKQSQASYYRRDKSRVETHCLP